MDNLTMDGVFSAIGDTFGDIVAFFASIPLVSLIVGALLAFFLALYGYKMFKVVAAIVTGAVGFALGTALGSIILYIVGTQVENPPSFLNWIPTILSAIFGIWFVFLGYKNPFGLIKFVVGLATYLGTCIYCVLQMSEKYGADAPAFSMVLNYIVIPMFATLIVGTILSFLLTLFVLIATSFGGSIAGVSCIMSLLPIPFIQLVAIIIGAVLGVGCFIFQVKNTKGKCSLKSFLLKRHKKEKAA